MPAQETRKAAPKNKTQNKNVLHEEPEHEAVFKRALQRADTSVKSGFKKSINILQQRLEEKTNEARIAFNEIERLKVALMKKTEETVYTSQPDDAIRADFIDLMARVKTWVKDCGVNGRSAKELPGQVVENITEYLSSPPNPFTSTLAMASAVSQGISSSILLNAIVTRHLFNAMLHKPFFFLEHLATENSVSDLSDAIRMIHKFGAALDSNRANVWQSQTMALLQPETIRKQTTSSQGGNVIEDLKRKKYCRVVDDLLDDRSIQVLFSNDTEEKAHRRNKLLQITSDLGDFLTRLGSQKVRIVMSSFDGVSSRLFRVDNKEWKPHPSMHLESCDTSCDGNRILLVVEPGVLAFGNERGTNYDQSKVWHPVTIVLQRSIEISDTEGGDDLSEHICKRRERNESNNGRLQALPPSQDQIQDHKILNGDQRATTCGVVEDQQKRTITATESASIISSGYQGIGSCTDSASAISNPDQKQSKLANNSDAKVVSLNGSESTADHSNKIDEESAKRKSAEDADVTVVKKPKIYEAGQPLIQIPPTVDDRRQPSDGTESSKHQQVYAMSSIDDGSPTEHIKEKKQTPEQAQGQRDQIEGCDVLHQSPAVRDSTSTAYGTTCARKSVSSRADRRASKKAALNISAMAREVVEVEDSPEPTTKQEEDPSYPSPGAKRKSI